MRGEKKCEFVIYAISTVVSPEPEVAAMRPPNLINDPVRAFKRDEARPNPFSHLRETCAEKRVRICRLRHLNGYISGTGSRRHETSELDQ